MEWSANVWTAIIAAFIVGCIVGAALLKTVKGNVQKQLQLEQDLKNTQSQLSEQKEQLEEHFRQSAEMLATLANDYRKLYTHLANSAGQLLPESAPQIEFFQNAQLKAEEKTEQDNPPKDYSEGSSGILKS